MIEFSGSHTLDDIRAAVKMHFRMSPLAWSLILVPTVLAVLAASLLALTGDFWLVPSVAITVVFVFMVRVGMPHVIAVRTWRASDLHAQAVEGTASHESLATRRPTAQINTPWVKFTGAKIASDVVVLYLSPYDYGYLARRLFRSEGDWNSFVTLVRSKVPILKRGAAQVLISLGFSLIMAFILFAFLFSV